MHWCWLFCLCRELSSARKISADLTESSFRAEATLTKLEKEEQDVFSLFDFIKSADKSLTKPNSSALLEKSDVAGGNHFLKDQKAPAGFIQVR